MNSQYKLENVLNWMAKLWHIEIENQLKLLFIKLKKKSNSVNIGIKEPKGKQQIKLKDRGRKE